MEKTMNAQSDDNQVEVEINETLHKTDLGDFILKYKKLIISILALVLVAVVAVLLVRKQQAKALKEQFAKIEAFKEQKVKSFEEKKISAAELAAAFKAMPNELKHNTMTLLSASEVTSTMEDQAQAINILNDIFAGADKNSSLVQLMGLQLATLQDNAGETSAAIATLESIIKSPAKFASAKIYFELGRLYLAKGDQARAKSNFDYVIAQFPNHELAKFSKLYLEKIK